MLATIQKPDAWVNETLAFGSKLDWRQHSDDYDSADYIRNYEDFMKLAQEDHHVG
jgi:hypothetical protein